VSVRPVRKLAEKLPEPCTFHRKKYFDKRVYCHANPFSLQVSRNWFTSIQKWERMTENDCLRWHESSEYCKTTSKVLVTVDTPLMRSANPKE